VVDFLLLNKTRHQGIPGSKEVGRLAKKRTTGVFSDQTAVIPFSRGRKLIERYLGVEHQARWDACTGCHQSKTWIRYLLPSRADELLAFSRLKLRVAVGLLIGHTILRAHVYKLGLTERQDCRLCGDDKEYVVHIIQGGSNMTGTICV
jgi:hypothetical protein